MKMPMVSTDAMVAVTVNTRAAKPASIATMPNTTNQGHFAFSSEVGSLRPGEMVNPGGGCMVMMSLSGGRVDNAMNKAESAGRFVLGICDFNVDVGILTPPVGMEDLLRGDLAPKQRKSLYAGITHS